MRGSRSLDNPEYDSYLASRKGSRSARQELEERNLDKRNANDGIRGYHFGIGDKPVYTESMEHFKHELETRGLMLKDDVRKNLRGPARHANLRSRYVKRGRRI